MIFDSWGRVLEGSGFEFLSFCIGVTCKESLSCTGLVKPPFLLAFPNL